MIEFLNWCLDHWFFSLWFLPMLAFCIHVALDGLRGLVMLVSQRSGK